jgi:hypothetical protein
MILPSLLIPQREGADMRNDPRKEVLNAWRNLFLATGGVAALVVSGVLTAWAQSGATQSSTTQSLEAKGSAGVKMAFDVASVKPNNSGGRFASNIGPLYPGAPYTPTGGSAHRL